MNEKILIENILKGIEAKCVEHVQGFPDSVCFKLRGVYSLIFNSIKSSHTDPKYKAASILTIISVAGGLITVTDEGYRCNDGFLDSFGSFYYSPNPVLENLKLMESNYCNDDYFVDKAILYFKHCKVDNAVSNLKNYSELIKFSFLFCKNEEDKMQINYLYTVMRLLSSPLPEDSLYKPEYKAWDSENWLKEFLPIWDRRIRREQHEFRAKYYKKHIDLVETGVYISQSGKKVQIPWDAYKMMTSSKMYSSELTIQPSTNTFDTIVEVWKMDCLDAARKIQNETEGITAVLNLANRQNPGGGVFTGSGAQEESCFLRSNYYTALYPFAEYAHRYDLPKAKEQYPLDRNFGGVWSEGITIFRGRELEGYPLLDEPWKTNFIAVAAINRPQTIEENGEIRLHPDMIQGALNKIHTIMNIAADNNVINLVLGAMGCGAFRNPPKHIAELFRQVLNEPQYKGRFRRVVFAIINEDLCNVFSDVFKDFQSK